MTLVDGLTLEEKASLCLGSDVWHTAPLARAAIPAITLSDGPHGMRHQPAEADHVGVHGSLPATCFPTASALASSFDADLVRRVGAAIAEEAHAQDVQVVLGPGINIKRSPLCGRNFEYFSEDPLVAGVLGAALVEGIQSRGVGACVKHFAANNQETDRVRVSADVDERTLREIYLSAFERVVTRARPWTVMCAYNKVNGIYASQHGWLLTTVLRDEWGFDGLVMSDWGAVGDRVAALAAGLDLEMPPNLGVSDASLVAAVRDGKLAEAVLDRSAERVLRLVERSSAGGGTFDADAHHALARAAATECAVLLKNDADLLPLQPSPGDVIAVVGEFARTPRFQGAGSSQVNPTRVDVPLDALRAGVPEGVEVVFAHDDDAVDLAARATTVVAYLGLPATAESEGRDRTHIDLPEEQTALLARLAAVNSRIVVVLANGSAVRLSNWEQHAGAVLECWLAGQAAGSAVADLLLGDASPSGRLAETLPLRLEDTPSYLNFPGEAGHVRYGEGVFVGYRGYDALDRDVSYPFGHGLSYTRFEYSDLEAAVDGVACRVTNVGPRRGKEVVQLYVGDLVAAVARPPRELRGFAKVDLEPGESTTVRLPLTERDFSYWSTGHGRWALEPGEFQIAVGASSRDLRLTTTIEVGGPAVAVRLDDEATLEEWLAHPVGGPLLREALSEDGILADEDLVVLIGNFPLRRLTAFPGFGVGHTLVDDLLRRLTAT